MRRRDETDYSRSQTEREGPRLVRPAKTPIAADPPGAFVGKLDGGDLDTNDPSLSVEAVVYQPDPGTGQYTATSRREPVFGSPARRLGVILNGMWIEAQMIGSRYVVTAGGKARSIEVEFRVDFVETDATVSCSVLDFRDGDDPDPTDAGLDVLNTFNRFRGASGAKGTALYDPELDQYYLVQADCPAVS